MVDECVYSVLYLVINVRLSLQLYTRYMEMLCYNISGLRIDDQIKI